MAAGAWPTYRLKQLTRRFHGGGTPDSGNTAYYAIPGSGHPWLMIGDMSRRSIVATSRKCLTEEGRRSKNLEILPPGTVVYAMYASVGEVAELAIPAAINQALIGISTHPDRLLPRFLVYALENKRAEVLQEASASTQPNLSAQKVKNLQISAPSVAEQTLIVRYLDNAELRIAKAIVGKQDLVRLLNERRSAIEAELLLGVPDASAEDWFGHLPDGWSRLPARAICSERIRRGEGNLDLLSVTIRRGVIPQREYFSAAGSKKDQSRTDKSQYKAVRPGDVVYNKMRAWQGAAGCSAYEGIVSPAYVVIQPNQLVDPSFLGRVMRTPQFAKEAERWSYGINSDMWSLRPQHFKLIDFAVPPLDVQQDLVRRCTERTGAIEAALVAVDAEIALLKEYRTRLISDVVTGKIDVREEAAKLPDIDPAELTAVLAGGTAGSDETEEDANGDD